MSSGKKIRSLIIETRGYRCDSCGLSDWRDNPICLELDHIDGDNKNNDLANLRLLCPNCHSQTVNFRGRNINTGSNKVSDDSLIAALSKYDSIRQALISVGLTPKGGNYKRASRLLNLSYSRSIDTKNSQYGTCWINNGYQNKKVKKEAVDEHLDSGWEIGRIVTRLPPSNKGKYWVTNGLVCRLVTVTPDGFWKGRFQKSSIE